jgi:LCP family protein required for cell wall assembly
VLEDEAIVTKTAAPPNVNGWGPTVRGRGRRRRWRHILAIALVLVVLLPIVFAVWASGRINRIEVEGLAARGTPMHILVVGSDSVADLTREERRELGVGAPDGERTDTIFIMSVRGGQTALLAFPRDLWVQRCDGSTGRINVAQQIGGPSCLVETVRDLSGIDVHHYLSVGFGGFRDVVDAVGGVELCLDEPIRDRDANIDLPAGCQSLVGRDALGYVRVRKIDNDLMRIQRQQTFLRALAAKILEPSTLLNPVRLLSVTDSIGAALTADSGMGPLRLARVTRGLRGLAGGTAITETVPAIPGFVGSAAVLHVDDTLAQPLFQSFRDGDIFDEAERDRSQITLRVLNGTDRRGLATQMAELLGARGYNVSEVGNADPHDTTVILYPPGGRADAELVAGDVPGEVTLRETRDVAAVTLILGRDTGTLE